MFLKNLRYKNRTSSINDIKIDLRESSSRNTLTLPAPPETIIDSPSRNSKTVMQEAEQQKESEAQIIHNIGFI
jgi:hypothetical protein